LESLKTSTNYKAVVIVISVLDCAAMVTVYPTILVLIV